MEKLLSGKSIIVTGSGGYKGIGRAIALRLAAEGANLVINDFGTDADGRKMADIVVNEIIKNGGNAVANYDSVASMDGGANIVKTCTDTFGKIDALVNCAGNHIAGMPLEATEAAFDSMVAIHLKGHFACAQAAAKEMAKQGGGCIINFSSQSSFCPEGAKGAQMLYGMVKAGVLALTTHMACGLAEQNIRVNDILPDSESKMNADPSLNMGMGDGMPLPISPRQPEYIAAIVAYLVSDKAKEVTGKHIYVGGADFCIYGPILYMKGEPNRFFRNGDKTPWKIEDLDTIRW